ncbi:MAG: YggS family pyridoxal phosphate-dependent enzyme [Candidatus Melainabacteria bacterium]|nr:MAG: YggS family pyridoxal phosphate-dependent enzyme [Candidatus Melainabacteria bacterium]
MSVAENIARIREALGQHAVTLVAVTKGAAMGQIEEAHRTGVTEFGESRVQDAIEKMSTLPDWLMSHSHWHFIGHLQSNKVKQAVGRFALIHSVDSLKLAAEISRISSSKGITQPILLQVKIAADPNKSGFTPDELKRDFAEISRLVNIECRGLMTITPLEATAKERVDCFNGLRLLRDELAREHRVALPELSMGMSNDWRQAIDCGATMVRIGSEIFRQ